MLPSMRAASVEEPTSYWPVGGVMWTVWRRPGATLILIVTGMYRLVCSTHLPSNHPTPTVH